MLPMAYTQFTQPLQPLSAFYVYLLDSNQDPVEGFTGPGTVGGTWQWGSRPSPAPRHWQEVPVASGEWWHGQWLTWRPFQSRHLLHSCSCVCREFPLIML